MNDWTLELASTPESKADVYRFRYSVYVEEMNRTQFYADHAAKTVIDPLDTENSNLFVARCGAEVVGTVRTNYLSRTRVGVYEELYDLPRTFRERESVSITTRLMISRKLRRTKLGLALSVLTYQLALRDGICEDFIDCNPPLVPLFSRLGYRRIKDICHPEYGRVVLMKIQVKDLKYLEEVSSPFASYLSDWERGQSYDCTSTIPSGLKPKSAC